MRNKLIVGLVLIAVAISCKNNQSDQEIQTEAIQIDAEKWSIKEGEDYPFRSLMVDDILYTDKIRKLEKEKILDILGEPNREQDNHLYYKISEKKMGPLTLSASFIVIKLTENGSVEWIKLHGG